jgi:hypothetical protein
MSNVRKEELIEEIRSLIDSSDNKVEINMKYIMYFELDELQEIKEVLLNKEIKRKDSNSDYLDDIFNKCS